MTRNPLAPPWAACLTALLGLAATGCGAETGVVDALANKGTSIRPVAVITGETAVKKGGLVQLSGAESSDPNSPSRS